MLTTHPHLAPRSKKEYSYVSVPFMGLHDLLYSEICLLLYSGSPVSLLFQQYSTHIYEFMNHWMSWWHSLLFACCPQGTAICTVYVLPTQHVDMIAVSLQVKAITLKICVHFRENKSGFAGRWELIGWRRAHRRPQTSLTRSGYSASGAGCQHAEVQVHCHTREGGWVKTNSSVRLNLLH